MKIHKKSELPVQMEGEPFSVDVITYDKSGLVNIGFYNYDSRTWGFHLDTSSNDTAIEFVWMYPSIDKMQKTLIRNIHKTRHKQRCFFKISHVFKLWRAAIKKYMNREKPGCQ